MPYVVTIFPIDFGGFIALGPALTGVLTTFSPVSATDRAAATTASPFTLRFGSAVAPPPGAATLLVSNTGPSGDLFRSGLLGAFPPSPGTVTVLSVPPAATTLLRTSLTTMLAARVPISLTPPGWLTGLIAVLTAGTFIPVTGVITGIVPTLTPPSTVTLTVTGFFVVRVGFFSLQTILFTGSLIATPASSGDVFHPSRILSLPTTATLATVTTGPSFSLAMMGLFLSLVAPAVASAVAPILESAINDAIAAEFVTGLRGFGFRRTSTSVISARSVRVTPTSIALQMVLADLLGPAVTPIPGNLNVTVTPQPQADVEREYTFTVTRAGTGAPVSLADVTLRNYSDNGSQHAVGPRQTDPNGQVKFNLALHPKITVREISDPDPGGPPHERERVFASPTLKAEKSGFNTFTMSLLEDDR